MDRLTKRYTYDGKNHVSVDSRGNGISCSNFCTGCGKADCEDIRKALFKLAEYEDLEEQGKLPKLPCAVGDTVHSFSFGKILTFCVDSFVIYTDGIYARLSSKMKEYEFLKIDMDIADFGKKWFATQEEAEAALKEL